MVQHELTEYSTGGPAKASQFLTNHLPYVFFLLCVFFDIYVSNKYLPIQFSARMLLTVIKLPH